MCQLCVLAVDAKGGGQIPLELELQLVLQQHVGSRNQTQVLFKGIKFSEAQNHLSSKPDYFFNT